MIAIELPDLVGLVGVGLIVVSYFLLQVERVTFDSPVYLTMNLLGASSILFSLVYDWNIAAALIEIFWIGISLFGLLRSLLKKKTCGEMKVSHLSAVIAMCLFVLLNTIETQSQPMQHPNIDQPGWTDLFDSDLSNAIKPDGIWSYEAGILTASEDQNIWSTKVYDNFIIDLEFKTAEGTNSGVIIYVSDVNNWIPNSVEIQIADDYAQQWADSPATWQCGAIFGHLPASRSVVKEPGEWNRYTIIAMDEFISVILNGELITQMDMKQWTSATTNPDGSEIPEWLSTPFADLPRHGHVGFQGKHAGAPIWFRNIKIKELPPRVPSVILPAEIARVLREYEKGWQARDSKHLASLFTEDGFILRPGHPPVQGRANIQRAYEGSGGPLALRALQYSVSGDTGYIIGGYSRSTFMPDSGKFVLALRKAASGDWLIAADMDNGNN